MRTPHCFAAFALLGASSFAQQTFKLDDVRQIVGVSSARIAPDGANVAVITSRANYAEDHEELQLCVVDVANANVRTLTYGRKFVAAPAWSPDSTTIAFLAPDPSGKPQVWLLPMRGGEARCLTNSATGVNQFAWRPDGGAIAFVADDEAPKLEGEAKHLTTMHVGDQDMFLKEPIPAQHLWLKTLGDEAAKRLTSGAWSLEIAPPPSSGASPIHWSKDGKRIVFAKVPTTQTGRLELVTAAIVDVASGAVRSVNAIDRFQSAPDFSPDGQSVIYRYPRDGKMENLADFYISTDATDTGRSLTRAIDRDIFDAEWMPGGKELLVAGNDRTSVGLWLQPLDGAPRALDLDGLVVNGAFGYDYSVSDAGAIAFVATRANRPSELYLMSSATAKPRCLSHFNAWADSKSFASLERVTWKSADGFDEDGVVALPSDLSSPHPLVLLIHGGPTSASKTSFSVLMQLMAAEGWVVFSPNYRGSDNLGNAYAAAILNDAGEGPGRDVMAGIAELAKRPYVDATRKAVTGWSYGGYMTTWMLGKYPNEWKCGVAGAPVTNWIDQYDLSDGNVQIRYSFGGSPWTGDFAEKYREQSPITYATKIKAPTLVMANLEDFRVPPVQAFELHHALKDNGVETDFVAFQGRTHASSDPVNSTERVKLWIGWVKSHLGEQKLVGSR